MFVYVCAQGVQKTMEPLEQELLMVLSHHGRAPRSSVRVADALNP